MTTETHEPLEIGKNYNLHLKAAFGGFVSLRNVILKGNLATSAAMKIDNVVGSYREVQHELPEDLKELDIDSEVWHMFKSFTGETVTIIPSSFVVLSSVDALTTVRKTYNIEFASPSQVNKFRLFLSDQGIRFIEN